MIAFRPFCALARAEWLRPMPVVPEPRRWPTIHAAAQEKPNADHRMSARPTAYCPLPTTNALRADLAGGERGGLGGQGGPGDLHDLGEGGTVVDGEVGQHLAVHR